MVALQDGVISKLQDIEIRKAECFLRSIRNTTKETMDELRKHVDNITAVKTSCLKDGLSNRYKNDSRPVCTPL